jgi:hypothetical protein
MPVPNTVNDTVGYTPRNIYACEDVLVDIDDGNRLDIYGDVYLNGARITGGTQIDAKSFGAKGDGVTDDTAALQAWATYIATQHKIGFLSNGTYKITGTIIFPAINSFSVIGESRSGSIIKQYTDNIPCFMLGDHNVNPSSQIMHSVVLRCIHFTHNTLQLSTATNSIGVAFGVSVYYSWFEMLQFSNLGWGMKCLWTTEYAPWGNVWNDFVVGNMSIGAIDLATGGGATPNNIFGRMTINCGMAIGPIFDIQGYNFHIQALEFLNVINNPQLIVLTGGCQVTIDDLKIEATTYNLTVGSNLNIFSFLGSCQVWIGNIFVGGTFADFSGVSGGIYLVAGGSNSLHPDGWSVRVGTINVNATSMSGAYGALIFGGSAPTAGDSGGYEVDHVIMKGGWQLSNVGGATTAECIRISSWQNNRLSANKGDANYTVTMGDPNIVNFATAFTAARTITLPAKAGNNLFNGLSYTFVFDGAINGANTAIIKEGTNTLRTQTTDKAVLTYTWRRLVWVLTNYQTLP